MKNIIIFPGFNFKFLISNVACNIVGINIYWYAIFITLGFLIALIALKKDCINYKIQYDEILKLTIWLIPISIIFARLYYILFNINYYLNDFKEIINIRNGGLAIYGGIIGAIITIITYCKVNRIDTLNMSDMLVPYLALGQSLGRWGNFFNIEAYGTITKNIFRMGIIRNGIYMEVHPTFLYESISTFIIFLILIKTKKKRKYKGELTLIYLILYSAIRAVIESLRIDSLYLGRFRISQVLSIIIFIITTVIFLKNNIYEVRDTGKCK